MNPRIKKHLRLKAKALKNAASTGEVAPEPQSAPPPAPEPAPEPVLEVKKGKTDDSN